MIQNAEFGMSSVRVWPPPTTFASTTNKSSVQRFSRHMGRKSLRGNAALNVWPEAQ
jgi:hypothetical protein